MNVHSHFDSGIEPIPARFRIRILEGGAAYSEDPVWIG